MSEESNLVTAVQAAITALEAVAAAATVRQDQLQEVLDRVRAATPYDMGSLTATPTIPFADHVSVVGAVGAYESVTVTLTPPEPGMACVLKLRCVDVAVTVTMPSIKWAGGSI